MNRQLLPKPIQTIRRWMEPVVDPVRVARGINGYRQFFGDWRRYSSLPDAEPVELRYAFPQLHDRTSSSEIDAHYFYVNNWATRRIQASAPAFHIDVGSQTIFSSLLAAKVPTVFVDYRPLRVSLPGLQCLGGNLLGLPFPDQTLTSLSCLHVVEHIGLGRYGDPLDSAGTYHAIRELTRVLAPGGSLFLATPVGLPRLCFNAHRIHSAEQIRTMVPELELVEFSGVDDAGHYHEAVTLSTFAGSDYACGFFWLRRPA